LGVFEWYNQVYKELIAIFKWLSDIKQKKGRAMKKILVLLSFFVMPQRVFWIGIKRKEIV
jgi:hypothetical protein